MRILIVDDNQQKRLDVKRCLHEANLGAELTIGEAVDYEEALTALKEEFYDLVILDVMLPGAGGGPSKDTSRALIRMVMAGADLIPPTNIIALTAFPEVEEKERAFYDEHIFAIETYDETSDGWRNKLISKIKYLRRSKRAGAEFYRNSFNTDILVIAARYENEFVPIKDELFHKLVSENHAVWRRKPLAIGLVEGPQGLKLRTTMVCASEMGMATTAAVAAEAIGVFRPRLVVMLGMCCGFATDGASVDQKFLNALVVREVSCWEVGKYVETMKDTPEFLSRAKSRQVNEAIRDEVDSIVERQRDTIRPGISQLLARGDMVEITRDLPSERWSGTPEVRFGPIVSGSSVIASEEVIKEIIQRHPSALGLDMEVYGLYTAVEQCVGLKPSVLAIKGVADFGDASKADKAQLAASKVATVVFKSILAELTMFMPEPAIASELQI